MRFAAAIARWTAFGAPSGATASPLGSSLAVLPEVVGGVSALPPAPVPPDWASAGAGSAKSASAAMTAAMRPCV